MAKWHVDAGHGGKDPGASNGIICERDINLTVALETERVLLLNGQEVQMTRRDNDSYFDLPTRCKMANDWGADYFVSIHHNAGGGDGLETIFSIYHGVSEDLANSVANALANGTGQNIRRVYCREGDNNRDYYGVIRGTRMPAIINEFGFVDNPTDYEAFDTEAELIQEGRYIAVGLLKIVGITNPTFGDDPTPAPQPEIKVMYRVIMDGTQIMALSDQSKAETVVKQRVDGGLNTSGIVERNTDGAQLFIYPDPNVTPTPEPTPEPVPAPFEITSGVPIIGSSDLTAEQMATFCLKFNSNPKILGVTNYKSMIAFCNMFLEEGNNEGVRGDIAFCQSIHETGYFEFGGQVLPEQNNYGGIGAVNTSATGKGAWFNDAREGIRAQIQHLKGYASAEPLNQTCVDPRYTLLGSKLGCSPYWETLAGKWAVPGFNSTKYDSLEDAYKAGATYGQTIIAIYDKVKSTVADPVIEDPIPEPTPVPPTDKTSKYFSDIPVNHRSIDAFDKAYELGLIDLYDGTVGFTEDYAKIVMIIVKTIDYINKK
jgi:hypothetical protein